MKQSLRVSDRTAVGILVLPRDMALADAKPVCLQYCRKPTFVNLVDITPLTKLDVFILRGRCIQPASAAFKHVSNLSITDIIKTKIK